MSQITFARQLAASIAEAYQGSRRREAFTTNIPPESDPDLLTVIQNPQRYYEPASEKHPNENWRGRGKRRKPKHR